MNLLNLTSIRCGEIRPHGKYETCGRLLAAIDEGRIFLYCEMCKKFYELILKPNDNAELAAVSKDIRVKLKNKLRLMKDYGNNS